MSLKINTLYTNKVTRKSNRKIDWITIHYTAGTSSSSGKAKAIANGFATSNREASADYVVDDENIYLCNKDIKNQYTWSVGGNKYPNKTCSESAKYYGVCTNANSISIEMCSSKVNKSTLYATDTDWYFTDKVINLTVQLVVQLMKEHKIDINHVIMHSSVTGKVCPNPFCVNETALKKWYNFKNKIKSEISKGNVSNNKNKEDEEDMVIRYNKLAEVPSWGKETVQKMINKKLIADQNNLNLSDDMLRIFVMLDRNGTI